MRNPPCLHCDTPSDLTSGKEIYPHRRDLWEKPIWICRECGAYCGCHPGTEDALGYPCNKETRNARMQLHNKRLDPLWKKKMGGKMKRNDVYAYLAKEMGLSRDETHTGMFTIEQCREAWVHLGKIKDGVASI